VESVLPISSTKNIFYKYPLSKAAILESPLTEWALKTDVSTPRFPSTSELVFGRLLDHEAWHRGWLLLGSLVLYCCVTALYRLKHCMTHKQLSPWKAPNVTCLGGTSTVLFLPRVGKVNNTPSGWNTLYLRSNACSSDILLASTNAAVSVLSVAMKHYHPMITGIKQWCPHPK